MESEVINKYNRDTAEKTDRSVDAKFGHKDQAKGISFSPR
jgi:hypothetical protein